MARRFSALILTALLLAASVLGCASETGDAARETVSAADTTVTADTRLYPNLPEVTYDGYKYRFFGWHTDHERFLDDIDVEDIDGEIINDAVYNRNLTIEQKYDIEISAQFVFYIDYESAVAKNTKAGDDYADILLSMGHDIPRMYNQSEFYNLLQVPHLEFDMPWWDSNATEAFTLAGYMPFGVSDLTLLDKAVTSCVYFNKQLASDYTLGDLYSLVDNNEWTIAKVIELGKKVSGDLNGDSVYDENDLFGIVCDDDPVIQLFNSGGGRFLTKDSDGYPQLSFASERNFTLIQYYLENFMFDSQLTYNPCFTDKKQTLQMFADNQGAFMFYSIKAAINLRAMDTDFGILPIPKYEASQESYGNQVSVHGTNLISVPLTALDLDRTGVILEALSAESSYTVIPAFYDVVLKGKMARDEESGRMLDIIFSTRVYDVGDYYSLATFSDNFLRITGNAQRLTNIARTSDIASFYAKREKALNKALKDLIKVIDKWHELEA